MDMSGSSASMSSNPTGDYSDSTIFEEYRKTCSIIFGRATHSQMRYLQASIDLQHSLLNSCDSILAKQTSWLKDYLNKNNGKSKAVFGSNLEPFMRSYTAAVDAFMANLSSAYDLASSQIESNKKAIDIINQSLF